MSAGIWKESTSMGMWRALPCESMQENSAKVVARHGRGIQQGCSGEGNLTLPCTPQKGLKSKQDDNIENRSSHLSLPENVNIGRKLGEGIDYKPRTTS